MQFITGNNRHQTFFSALDEQVSIDNAVRIIDAFFDKPELAKMVLPKQFKRAKAGNFLVIVVKKIECATNKGGDFVLKVEDNNKS